MNTKSKVKTIGRLAGPFSLTGEIRVQFLEMDLAKYLVKNKIALYAENDDRTLTPTACRQVPKGIAFKFAEIPDRTAAEALSKGNLGTDYDNLPPVTEDNYDLDDLIDLKLQDEQGNIVGTVFRAYNFGASDIVDCISEDDDKKEFSIPLTPNTVINYDFDEEIIFVTDTVYEFVNL